MNTAYRLAFEAVGLDFSRYVSERGGRLGRVVAPLVGDASRLRQRTGWVRSLTFDEMVRKLVEAETARSQSQ